MYAWQFAKMNHAARDERLDALRQHAVPVQRALPRGRAGDVPYCRDQGIAVTTFSPLARGFLARDGSGPRAPPTTLTRNSTAMTSIARSPAACGRWPRGRGVSPAHVAMAWVAGSPNRNVPIVGAAKTAHLDVAVEALDAASSMPAERAFLEAPYRPRDEINDQNPVRRPRALHPG